MKIFIFIVVSRTNNRTYLASAFDRHSGEQKTTAAHLRHGTGLIRVSF